MCLWKDGNLHTDEGKPDTERMDIMDANKKEVYTSMDNAIERVLRDLLDSDDMEYTCMDAMHGLSDLADCVIENNDGWIYVDLNGNVKTDSRNDGSWEYRVAYNFFENWNGEFAVIKYNRPTTTIETEYCETSNRTFLIETVKNDDGLVSEEVIGFYSGVPNEEDTAFYSVHRSLKATYD